MRAPQPGVATAQAPTDHLAHDERGGKLQAAHFFAFLFGFFFDPLTWRGSFFGVRRFSSVGTRFTLGLPRLCPAPSPMVARAPDENLCGLKPSTAHLPGVWLLSASGGPFY
jgi:hypothetical protein